MKNTNKLYNVVILLVKLLTVVLFIVLTTVSCSAQGLKVSTYFEMTVSSPKLGHSAGVVFPGNLGDFEVGGFFQRAVFDRKFENTNKIIEEQFYGIYMSLSFIQMEKLNVNFNIRTGFANKESFTITPSVFSDIMISSSLGVGLGIGMRNFQPTYQSRIIVKLN